MSSSALIVHTSDGAQQPQVARTLSASPILVQHSLLGRLGNRNRQGDGLVEFAAAWLDGYYWRYGHAVAKHLGDDLGGHGLRLVLGV